MNDFRFPLGQWVEDAIDWITQTFGFLFDFVAAVVQGAYDGVDSIFSTPPFWAVIIVLAALGFAVRGWKFALGTVIGLTVIVGVDQWENAMDTLALVIVASVISILIAVPLGIAAARNRAVSNFLRPILDFTQTMPAFVYLIPALILFGIGAVPGVVATIIFSVAPGLRLTELGIRGVDTEVVEAGQAFGASPWRILRQIQLPLALPSIMAGVNQVIMLSLSMVVIAGMVGAGGLGRDVVASLNRIDVALGFEAGLSVVILAIFLDRITAALGGGKTPLGRLLGARGRKRLELETRDTPALTGQKAPAARDLVDA
ncbi:ABC transporter permease [Conyzicola sp.]|uniref:ABC transporter permease n=1 Tax=Conyzicola sp. TaxID=1969404 RepID=UPI0039893562